MNKSLNNSFIRSWAIWAASCSGLPEDHLSWWSLVQRRAWGCMSERVSKQASHSKSEWCFINTFFFSSVFFFPPLGFFSCFDSVDSYTVVSQWGFLWKLPRFARGCLIVQLNSLHREDALDLWLTEYHEGKCGSLFCNCCQTHPVVLRYLLLRMF